MPRRDRVLGVQVGCHAMMFISFRARRMHVRSPLGAMVRETRRYATPNAGNSVACKVHVSMASQPRGMKRDERERGTGVSWFGDAKMIRWSGRVTAIDYAVM
jgi:hypothetical protein